MILLARVQRTPSHRHVARRAQVPRVLHIGAGLRARWLAWNQLLHRPHAAVQTADSLRALLLRSRELYQRAPRAAKTMSMRRARRSAAGCCRAALCWFGGWFRALERGARSPTRPRMLCSRENAVYEAYCRKVHRVSLPCFCVRSEALATSNPTVCEVSTCSECEKNLL